jgi:hypothetical protein
VTLDHQQPLAVDDHRYRAVASRSPARRASIEPEPAQEPPVEADHRATVAPPGVDCRSTDVGERGGRSRSGAEIDGARGPRTVVAPTRVRKGASSGSV